MKVFVAIIPKSPLPQQGRIGGITKQDWYKTCLLAKSISVKYSNCPIYISSAFQNEGVMEADFYQNTLENIATPAVIIKGYDGMETVGHLGSIFDFAKRQELTPIIICTYLHAPRVNFISSRFKYGYELLSASGRPRPKEAITDIILTFLFPLIYYAGKEKWFIKKTTGRRQEGKI